MVSAVVLFHGCAPKRPARGSTGPSFKVSVDTRLTPGLHALPPFADGVPRPLATLTDGSGRQTDFVENELMVEFRTDQELSSFLATWHGTILGVDRPRSVGIEASATYLIRVQTENVSLARLNDGLRRLNPGGGSPIVVSSDAGRRLIAIGAATATDGTPVGINYLASPSGFQDGNLAEAPTAATSAGMVNNAGTQVEQWNTNPFQWVYMKRGGSLDIGVAAAWGVLERVGAFNRKVTIAVLDGGYGAGEDFPAPYRLNNASVAALDPTGPNQVECNKAPCPWHGWNVVNAAMGQVNNGVGAAGPAGPVANLIAIRRTEDVFNNIQAITLAMFSDASIINMSFIFRVPATLSWSLVPFNLATLRANGAGKLLYASAGNDAEDINDEDCFIVCWESAWIAPCENGGVICVGAMDANAPLRRTSSNYGGDELDIWGAGSVWVGADYANGAPHVFTATSAASPFVAGIAAMIWAANPGLDNDGVERVMYETAHQGKSGEVERWPNAYEAVVRALGGTPPIIGISVTSAQVFASCQPMYQFTATVTDPDHGPPIVTWMSDRDGVLGAGSTISRPLSDGHHRITATAVDGIGLTVRSNEVVLTARNPGVQGPRPTIDILSLANHQNFAVNQMVTFEAAGWDPFNGLGGLIPANVRWSSSKDGDLGAGQRLVRTLTVGTHYVLVQYTGKCGGTADDLRLIQITRAVADAPPNMHITSPQGNDLIARTDNSGTACMQVGGFGFDEEDQDFATIEWWETNRTDLQWKVLSFEQRATICLKPAANAAVTAHDVRLRGRDKTGHVGYSPVLRIQVLPAVR
jgi:serine protease